MADEHFLSFVRTATETESLDVWCRARAQFEDNLSGPQRALLATAAIRSLSPRQAAAVWAATHRQPGAELPLAADERLRDEANDWAMTAEDGVLSVFLAAILNQCNRDKRGSVRVFLDKLDARETAERKDAA